MLRVMIGVCATLAVTNYPESPFWWYTAAAFLMLVLDFAQFCRNNH